MSRSRFLKPDAELRRLELELDLLGKVPREKWDERLKDIGDRFATRRPPPGPGGRFGWTHLEGQRVRPSALGLLTARGAPQGLSGSAGPAGIQIP